MPQDDEIPYVLDDTDEEFERVQAASMKKLSEEIDKFTKQIKEIKESLGES